MIKKIALPVLALLLSTNAQELSNKNGQHTKGDAQIAKIKNDVDKIAQT